VCAVPMGMLPVGGLRPGGDMLASWAEGLSQSRAGGTAVGACGSRFTGGCRLRTGRIR
jgi:hypothetical protein